MAVGETTFSCRRRLKTYPRDNITDEWFSVFAVPALETEFVKRLDLEAVVDKFDYGHQKRIICQK
jgi:hypothetical protein